jgi:hypothetical protein
VFRGSLEFLELLRLVGHTAADLVQIPGDVRQLDPREPMRLASSDTRRALTLADSGSEDPVSGVLPDVTFMLRPSESLINGRKYAA